MNARRGDPLTIRVEPSGAACGALVYGLDLTRALSPVEVKAIRAVWLEHQVIGIFGQNLGFSDLERFAATLGPERNHIGAIPGHPRVVEVRREADKTTQVAGPH